MDDEVASENTKCLESSIEVNDWKASKFAIMNNLFIVMLQAELDLWHGRTQLIEDYFKYGCSRWSKSHAPLDA